MAIKYLDAKRIRGSSTALKDSTYTGWAGTKEQDGTQVTESGDVVTFNIQTRATNHTVSNDLGSTLSNSEWVLRCKLDYVTITGGGDSTVYFELGVGSANADTGFSNNGMTSDFIGLQNRVAQNAGDLGWGLVGYNSSGSLNNPESPVMDADPNTSTTYYVEIKRLSPTSMSIGLYTDSNYDTLISGLPIETKTISSGVTGLQYLRVGNAGMISENSTGNVLEGTIRDFKIWNATTSATQDEKATLVTAGYKSAGFDGANDNAISAGSLGISLGNNYSFGGWVNPEAQSSSIGMALYMAGALYLYRLSGVWKTEGNGISITGSVDVGVDSWKHVMVNVVSGTATLYVDGVADGTDASTNATATISQIQFGEEGTSYEYKGNLTDWFFYSRYLTTAEIASLSGGAKVSSISQANLEANYTFDSNLNDRSSNSRHLATVTGDVTGGNTKGTSPISPTSVLPENTLFDETDTYKTYWLSNAKWTPTGMPIQANLTAWYDASDLGTVTKDGSNIVTQLNDKSGNGYNLTEPSATAPLWVEAGQNGRNHIDFASGKRMRALWAAKAQPVTICAVVRTPTSTGSQQQIWDNYDNTEDSKALANEDGSDTKLLAYAPSSIKYPSSGDTTYSNTWTFFVITYNGSSSSMRINGVEKVTGNVGSNDSYGITLSTGRGTFNSLGNIILGEFMEFDEALSASDITTINNYFAAKWGITIGS